MVRIIRVIEVGRKDLQVGPSNLFPACFVKEVRKRIRVPEEVCVNQNQQTICVDVARPLSKSGGFPEAHGVLASAAAFRRYDSKKWRCRL